MYKIIAGIAGLFTIAGIAIAHEDSITEMVGGGSSSGSGSGSGSGGSGSGSGGSGSGGSGSGSGSNPIPENGELAVAYRAKVRGYLDTVDEKELSYVRYERTVDLGASNPAFRDTCYGNISTGSTFSVIGYVDGVNTFYATDYKKISAQARREIVLTEITATQRKLSGYKNPKAKGEQFSYLLEVHPDTLLNSVPLVSQLVKLVKEVVKKFFNKDKPEPETEYAYSDELDSEDSESYSERSAGNTGETSNGIYS